jgi:hypothetical protein
MECILPVPNVGCLLSTEQLLWAPYHGPTTARRISCHHTPRCGLQSKKDKTICFHWVSHLTLK